MNDLGLAKGDIVAHSGYHPKLYYQQEAPFSDPDVVEGPQSGENAIFIPIFPANLQCNNPHAYNKTWRFQSTLSAILKNLSSYDLFWIYTEFTKVENALQKHLQIW